ncbi:MAG: DUF4160 domain-containing protein [Reyranella sp.]|uniref:DUF4160 domain-containing protein n=1 Tax=Reyranella sp. TaxID=1929291 RepID=UPI001AC97384|nr:DUF4160 domain-containing protein [Reyranella sp.]MBN9089814.1 DUF4160 domain-containing protein [Reyranella sp.]
MPTIAVVDGILIILYFNDHAPPHFHAQGADFHARIRIEDGGVIDAEGRLSPRRQRRLRDWTLARRDELMDNWVKVRAGEVPRRLD